MVISIVIVCPYVLIEAVTKVVKYHVRQLNALMSLADCNVCHAILLLL